MRNPPKDSPNSVENTLRTLHLLRDQGELTVTDTAESLGISTAAAHRLLDALVYRDFAARDHRHRYLPGPALWLRPGAEQPITALRTAVLPAMRALAIERQETVSLGIVVGPRFRIVATAVPGRPRRAPDQEGTVLSTHLTAAGKALLAGLRPAEVAALYEGEDGRGLDPVRLVEDLNSVRRHGFALNHGEAEPGVSAVGVALSDAAGKPQAGLAVVMPSDRFHAGDISAHAAALRRTAVHARAKLRQVA